MNTFDFNTLKVGKYFLEGTIPFAKFGKSVSLHVDAPSVAAISQAQKDALNEFLNWNAAVFQDLEAPVYRYYLEMREYSEDEGGERLIVDPSGVWPYVYPSVVIIPDHASLPGRYVDIECNCEWEPEHGLEITVKNGQQVVYIGPFEGDGYRNDGRRPDGSPCIGNYVE